MDGDEKVKIESIGSGIGSRSDETGFALVFGLVFAFLLTLVALTFQGLGSMEADLVQRQVTYSQALYLAEGGLERAMYGLRLDPTWRGVDPLNGVAFAVGDRSLGNGSYDVLLYDGTDDGQGLYDRSLDPAFNPGISPGQLRLRSTGTAGPAGAGSSRRVESRVKVENGFNIPSFLYLSGELDEVELRGNFLIDGHDTDPLTGNREAEPCETRYGIASLGGIGEILKELGDRGTGNQVVGRGSPPSVAQVGQGVDVGQLVGKIMIASQSQSFYHTFKDKKIEANTTWGSYPNDLWVVRVEGELEVKKTLSGAGILIVEDELEIEEGAAFNWTGLVIVMNKNGKEEGEVELDHKGSGTLYGALLIGGENKESELELGPEANQQARFLYSCDALNAVVTSFSSFTAFRKVTPRSWREVSP